MWRQHFEKKLFKALQYRPWGLPAILWFHLAHIADATGLQISCYGSWCYDSCMYKPYIHACIHSIHILACNPSDSIFSRLIHHSLDVWQYGMQNTNMSKKQPSQRTKHVYNHCRFRRRLLFLISQGKKTTGSKTSMVGFKMTLPATTFFFTNTVSYTYKL